MHILSGVNSQKFRDVIDGHVIHTALHRTKQMVRQVCDVNRLENDQVKLLAADRVGIFNHSANCWASLQAEGRIKSGDLNGSVIVVDD